jgi:hypothetical protein
VEAGGSLRIDEWLRKSLIAWRGSRLMDARSRANSSDISAALLRTRDICSLISRIRLSCSSKKFSVIADLLPR